MNCDYWGLYDTDIWSVLFDSDVVVCMMVIGVGVLRLVLREIFENLEARK